MARCRAAYRSSISVTCCSSPSAFGSAHGIAMVASLLAPSGLQRRKTIGARSTRTATESNDVRVFGLTEHTHARARAHTFSLSLSRYPNLCLCPLSRSTLVSTRTKKKEPHSIAVVSIVNRANRRARARAHGIACVPLERVRGAHVTVRTQSSPARAPNNVHRRGSARGARTQHSPPDVREDAGCRRARANLSPSLSPLSPPFSRLAARKSREDDAVPLLPVSAAADQLAGELQHRVRGGTLRRVFLPRETAQRTHEVSSSDLARDGNASALRLPPVGFGIGSQNFWRSADVESSRASRPLDCYRKIVGDEDGRGPPSAKSLPCFLLWRRFSDHTRVTYFRARMKAREREKRRVERRERGRKQQRRRRRRRRRVRGRAV